MVLYLTYLLPRPTTRVPVRVHDVEELLNILHVLQQSAVLLIAQLMNSASKAKYFEL